MLAGGKVLEENCEDDEKLFNDGFVNRKWLGIYINDKFQREKKVIKLWGFYGNSLEDLNDFFLSENVI